jgi:hypothetical protein
LIASRFQSRLRYRFGTDEVFADDEEYSVISEPALRISRLVDATCTVLTGLVCEYFDGALAEAPASARSNASVDPDRITSAPTIVTYLDIASSIWFGDNPNKTELQVSHTVVVPLAEDDRVSRQAQSAIFGCWKDQQINLSTKKSATPMPRRNNCQRDNFSTATAFVPASSFRAPGRRCGGGVAYHELLFGFFDRGPA